jgi:EmrB/QacA subfamily drug resistance transporter
MRQTKSEKEHYSGSPQPQPQLHPHTKWWVLLAVGIGSIMSPLDGSVVNIALPVITKTFGTTITIVEWVSMAYLLTISTLLLTYGRVGDMIGHRQVYLGGFVVFTFGSLLCAFASGINMLIAFRVVQALGAGMMMSAGPAIITAAFPASERGRALGINGMMVGLGLAAGPALGGILVKTLGWRSIFMINLPIGMLGIWWAARVLPIAMPPTRVRSFDIPGATLLSAALFLILLALSRGQAWGWHSPLVMGMWVVGALLFVQFIRVEQRTADPMVDLSLFRIRLFSAANASALLNFMAQFTVTFLMPFYLQDTLAMPPNQAGLVMLAFPATMLVMAPISGSLSDRLGSSLLSPLGMAIVTVGLWSMSQLNAASGSMEIFGRLSLIGLGSGLFQAPNNSAIMGSVSPDRLGMASGMLATMRNIGMVLGIATSGAVFTIRQAYYMQAAPALVGPAAQLAALQDTFMVGAGFAMLGVLAALVRGRSTGGRAWRISLRPNGK